MSKHSRARFSLPDPLFILLVILLVVILVAGGAARADVSGQMAVRAASALCLAATILIAPRRRSSRPLSAAQPVPLYVLLATISLVVMQLLPLPSAVWQSLPGRDVLMQAVVGEQPWRPLSMVPDLTVNAAFSLIVPFVVLVLIMALPHRERDHLPASGLLVGGLAMMIGVLLAQQGIRRALRRAPRWAFPALLAGMAATIIIFVSVSISADRATSITRITTLDAGGDIRAIALPTVQRIALDYLPVGAGFGSFDPIFRLHEPFGLLKPTYFNHAHNDLIEIVIDGGLPALLLLLIAIGWWASSSIRIWRAPSQPQVMLGRMGSAMLLLIFMASTVDYPARTPMIMTMVVIAASWLGWGVAAAKRMPLPPRD